MSKPQKFKIKIRYGSRDYTYQVEMLTYALGTESYKVIAKNKELILQSNRPTLRRKGLKNWKPEWKLLSGVVANSGFLEELQNAIYQHVEKNNLPG